MVTAADEPLLTGFLLLERTDETRLPLFLSADEDALPHQGSAPQCLQRPASESLLALQVRQTRTIDTDALVRGKQAHAGQWRIAVLLTLTASPVGQERAFFVSGEDGNNPRALEGADLYPALPPRAFTMDMDEEGKEHHAYGDSESRAPLHGHLG
jgi:hypothetical protein